MSPATAKPHAEALSIDALLIGGGIAGVWILDALRREGKSVVLAESEKIGNGQSVCAQGIIHGGLKYALGGVASRDARQIAKMPEIWRESMEGSTSPDLSSAEVLSHHTWLWRSDSLRARVGMLGAKIGLQTRPEAVSTEDRPALLQNAPGEVLRVAEPVVEVRSVLRALTEAHRDYLVKVDGPEGIEFSSRNGRVDRAILRGGGEEITLCPKTVVLTAGTGNEGLRSRLGLETTLTQRRGLHMVLLQGALPPFFGHCIDGNRTRVTISSSAPNSEGIVTWQIGGELSESGVKLEEEPLIRRAQEELQAVLPDLKQEGLSWSTYRVDRAERATTGNRRPEDISIIEEGDGHTLTCWPTKLALAPRLAQEVCSRISQEHNAPELLSALASFPRPSIAPFPWDREFTAR